MLKTMLWQAALATLLIGGAAAGYAQVRDNGYLAAPRDTAKQDQATRKDNGKDNRKHGHDGDESRRAERGSTRHD